MFSHGVFHFSEMDGTDSILTNKEDDQTVHTPSDKLSIQYGDRLSLDTSKCLQLQENHLICDLSASIVVFQ